MSHRERAGGRVGRTFGPYRVVAELGEGGMGVVYRAEHSKLRKPVALKFLHPDLVREEAFRQRFAREARAAASLDHSNICPVYDYDERDGEAFIAMAFLEGRTLRERLAAEGPLPALDAVVVAIQVAEGLQEAHARGVVHRDVKPSNLMLLPSGQVKILDFGLATLQGATRITRSREAHGTVGYMSPEQATGKPTDGRTDLWSLGVVLYEMLAGRPPFGGDYPDAVLYAVVHDEPPPLREARPDAPPEAELIVRRALAKNPDERYTDAAAMLRDLRELRRRLAGPKPNPWPPWPNWLRWLLTQLLPYRARVALLAAALLVLAGAVVAWRLGFGERGGLPDARSWPVAEDVAWAGEPALSPDGSFLAYAGRAGGQQDIYVCGAEGGAALRLTQDAATDHDPAWLPDGTALLFASDRGGATGIWRVERLGGEPRSILANAESPAISPDGRWLAFGRADASGLSRIHVAPLDGSGEARRTTGDAGPPGSHTNPCWSPDGKRICFATGHDLWVVPAAGGEPRRLTRGGIDDTDPVWSADGRHVYFSSARDNTRALWRVGARGGMPRRVTPGSGPESHPSLDAAGRRLAYTTSTDEADEDVVLIDRFPGREALAVPGGRKPAGPAQAASEDTATAARAAGRTDAAAGMTGGPGGGGETWTSLAAGRHDDFQPTIAPDGGAVAFVSGRRAARNEVWLQRLRNGRPDGEAVQLTDQPGNACHPAFSPDGRWVAYYRYVGEQRDVWIVPAAGGPPHRFTDHTAEDLHPAWSPDGRRLAFASDREGTHAIWVAPVADGRPAGPAARLTPAGLPALFPAWSPDGASVAFIGQRDDRVRAFVVPAAGGSARELGPDVRPCRLRWCRASGALWMSAEWEDGTLSVRELPPGGGPARPLEPPVRLGAAQGSGMFDADGDGRFVTFSLPRQQGGVWVLEARSGSY